MPTWLTASLFFALLGAAAPTPGSNLLNPAVDAVEQLSVVDLEGRRWTSTDLRGRVVLIDFWATWCAPCLAELPRLQHLRERYARNGFEIIGINLDATSRRSLVSWLNRNRIDWPQVHQRAGYAGEVPRQFGIESLPRTILIDRDGSVAARDLRGDQLADMIALLVGRRHQPVGARER